MLRSALITFAFSTIFASASVFANQAFTLSATSAEEFRQQSRELQEQMRPGGKYANLSSADQIRVTRQLERLQELYDNRAAGKSFKRTDEVKLVNATEEINAVLTGNDDDRLVCEQERKLGTNRTQKVCMTVAERKARNEEARKDLRNTYTGAQGARGVQSN